MLSMVYHFDAAQVAFLCVALRGHHHDQPVQHVPMITDTHSIRSDSSKTMHLPLYSVPLDLLQQIAAVLHLHKRERGLLKSLCCCSQDRHPRARKLVFTCELLRSVLQQTKQNRCNETALRELPKSLQQPSVHRQRTPATAAKHCGHDDSRGPKQKGVPLFPFALRLVNSHPRHHTAFARGPCQALLPKAWPSSHGL
jgi:hypothetical protein